MIRKILIICLAVYMLGSVSTASEGEGSEAEHREVERKLGVLTDPEIDVNLNQGAVQPDAPKEAVTEEDEAVEQIRIEQMKEDVKEWDETLKENKKRSSAEKPEGSIEWRDSSGKIRKRKVE